MTFNSGHLDFGSAFGVVNLDNVTIETSVSEARLSRLNSIKAAQLKRRTFTPVLRGKVKSFNKELLATYFGQSSADGSGTLVTFKDGQQPTLNPVFTAYIDDDTTKPFQLQFTNAVIRSMPINTKVEDYGEIDFEMVAVDVNLFDQAG